MLSRFLSDNRAISPIIATALILAIGISTIGFIQQHYVPVWNAQAESEHFENVYQDMVFFSSNLESAGLSGIPRTSPIRLGLTYPAKIIVYNPKATLFGDLKIKQDVNITVKYTLSTGSSYTKKYNSTTLRYELPGNHPYLVYEHGIIIRDFSKFGKGNATGNHNTLVVEDNVNIPLLLIKGAGFNIVSVQPTIASIYPIEITDKKNVVEYLKYVNITLDTHYPEVWRHVLNVPNSTYPLSCVQGTNDTNICVNDATGKIYINTTAGNEIDLPDDTKQVLQGGRYYGGMAVVKTVATLQTDKGVGEESMGTGSVWEDIPAASGEDHILGLNITSITVDRNVYDRTGVDINQLSLQVADTNGSFWRVLIEISLKSTGSGNTKKKTGLTITKVEISNNLGTSCFKQSILNDYVFTSDITNDNARANNITTGLRNARIDLLKASNYATTNDELPTGNLCTNPPTLIGMYQNSSIQVPNSLVSEYMGDATTFKINENWILFYRLIIE
ncbi:MAG: hypothetical protein WC556_09250 [Candidatus Methanoperedens sp.]